MSVKNAEATVASLEQKRIKCVAHGTELQDERANVALAAHTGDVKARKRLDEINAALAVHSSELASLDAALRAATEQLERAREKEAQQTDRAAAAALLKESDHFRARFLLLARPGRV
jgi:chromosome segregation ATPase